MANAGRTLPAVSVPVTTDAPLSKIQIGDEVFSEYHGEGVMERFIGGTHPLRINFGGSTFTYSMEGKYFHAYSEFADKECMLWIINKMSARGGNDVVPLIGAAGRKAERDPLPASGTIFGDAGPYRRQ